MAVATRLKNRDYQTCNVILDFKEQKVIRCTMDGAVVPKDWDKIVSYYYQYYQATFERLFEENGHKLPETNEDQAQETNSN